MSPVNGNPVLGFRRCWLSVDISIDSLSQGPSEQFALGFCGFLLWRTSIVVEIHCQAILLPYILKEFVSPWAGH